MKNYYSNLDILDSQYRFLSFVFEESKSKKDRKRADDFIKSGEELYTEDDKKVLCNEKISLEEKIKYLEVKHNEFEKLKKLNDEENAKIQSDFCDDFGVAFKLLTENYDEFCLIKDGENISVTYIDNNAFRKTLIFHNAFCESEKVEFQSINWYELSKIDGKYCLEIAFSNLEDLGFCKITFESVSTKTESFNATNSKLFGNPWLYLSDVCEDIIKKNDYANEVMNEAEKELLPVAKAVTEIPYLPEMAKYVECDDEILENFENLAKSLQIYDITAEKIKKGKITITKLCNVKYEVLWNFIYEKVLSSQKDYPSKAEIFCDKDELISARKKITKIIKEAGFKGEYPDFYKQGAITKPVSLSSYGNDYILFSEKDVVHYIKCIESFPYKGQISFICGFVSNKTRKVYNPDAFSAMFSAKGKRYFDTLEFIFDEGEFDEMPDVETFAKVAVKKATLEKLTKEERKNYHFMSDFSSGKMFVFMFIFLSLWFGVLFTLAMMAFVLVMLWFETGSFDEASAGMLSLPWVALGALSGFSFGGITTLVIALIKKNSR